VEKEKLLRRCFLGVVLFFAQAFLMLWLFNPFDRTAEFRAQAKVGQRVVRGIEQFRKDTGQYPASLAELVPKYLAEDAIKPERSRYYIKNWEYWTSANNGTVSYGLYCYMGKADVEYNPPNWVANDDGNFRTLSIGQ
jgi:hypothetical protein